MTGSDAMESQASSSLSVGVVPAGKQLCWRCAKQAEAGPMESNKAIGRFRVTRLGIHSMILVALLVYKVYLRLGIRQCTLLK